MFGRRFGLPREGKAGGEGWCVREGLSELFVFFGGGGGGGGKRDRSDRGPQYTRAVQRKKEKKCYCD